MTDNHEEMVRLRRLEGVPVVCACHADAPIGVQVDEEYAAEEWWDALRECPDGARIEAAIDAGSVTPAQLDVLRSLPGWSDGPVYAPHPLRVVE
ncbi:MAG TPA: hypothetical protein VFP50_15290 [Anaeromyxobacteraceae bacterium]|nr:hypothetical protein [Anaeromyxobacteraceae bacterium]